MTHKLGCCETLLLKKKQKKKKSENEIGTPPEHSFPQSYFIVPPVTFPEIENEPLEDELPDLRKLGVDDGHHGSVHMGKDGRGGLGLKSRSGQKTPEERQPRPSMICERRLKRMSAAQLLGVFTCPSLCSPAEALEWCWRCWKRWLCWSDH